MPGSEERLRRPRRELYNVTLLSLLFAMWEGVGGGLGNCSTVDRRNSRKRLPDQRRRNPLTTSRNWRKSSGFET